MKIVYEQLLKQVYLCCLERKIIETGDGSKTIHFVEWNESYHSTHGALEEAEHVYINKVRERIGDRTEISILEMGFGTGLNAFLTLRLALELKIKVHFIGLEAYPVNAAELKALDYATLWPEGKVHFDKIHESTWGEKTEIHPNFSLTKVETKFEDWNVISNSFDFIYFDVFGPRVQPDLWSVSIFEKMFEAAKADAIILTYCAKGQVRRDLASVGFTVERVAGPPAKRHMLVGVK